MKTVSFPSKDGKTKKKKIGAFKWKVKVKVKFSKDFKITTEEFLGEVFLGCP